MEVGVGVTVRLFTETTDDLGSVTAPPPIEPDDLVAFEHGAPLRVVCVTPLVPGGLVGYIAEVTEAHIQVLR